MYSVSIMLCALCPQQTKRIWDLFGHNYKLDTPFIAREENMEFLLWNFVIDSHNIKTQNHMHEWGAKVGDPLHVNVTLNQCEHNNSMFEVT